MTGPLFPGNYSRIWVRGKFITMAGAALRGKLTLQPNVTGGMLVNRSAGLIMSTAPFEASTDNDTGYVAVQVPATNDPDITPVGFTYTVKTPTGQSYPIVVPYDTPVLNSVGDPLHGQQVLELIDVVPAPGSSGGVGQLLRGIGIQSIVDNGAGSLLITYTDGATSTIAMPDTVQGPVGPAGPAGAASTVPGPQGPPGEVSTAQLSAAVAAAKLADRPDVSITGAAVGQPVVFTGVGPATFGPGNVSQVLLTATGNGTADDTASINAQLATAPASAVVHGVPGKTYLISAPLVLRAGGRQTLDMTGCTVTLKAGSNSNMLQNAAVAAGRIVSDATLTSGSTTITSATAAFAAGDAGKSVRLWGGSIAAPYLDTTIASVTNVTTAVLAAAPTASKTNAAISIGVRDTDVAIIGGRWDRGANTGSGVANHSIRLRRADRVTIEGAEWTSTAGKYSVSVADCTLVRGSRLHFDNVDSDGFHGAGPLHNVTVERVTGHCEDDVVSFTGNDWAAYADSSGDMTALRIREVNATTGQSLVKVIAGVNRAVDDVKIDAVSGSATQYAAYLGDDTLDAATTGGTYGSVEINGMSADSTTLITLTGATWRRLAVYGVRRPLVTGQYVLRVVGAASIDTLDLSDVILTGTAAGAFGLAVTGSSNVRDINLGRWVIPDSPTTFRLCNLNGGTYDRVTVGGMLRYGDTASRTVDAIGTLTLGLVVARGLFQVGGRNILDVAATMTSGVRLQLSDVAITSPSRVANFSNGQTNTVAVDPSVRITTPVNEPVFVGGSSAVTVVGGPLNYGTSVSFAGRSASEVVRFIGQTLPIDVGLLARTMGDTAYNTNGSRACGLGPVICDGTSWKHLYTAAIYT